MCEYSVVTECFLVTLPERISSALSLSVPHPSPIGYWSDRLFHMIFLWAATMHELEGQYNTHIKILQQCLKH